MYFANRLRNVIPMGDISIVNRKGSATRGTRLSIRVPVALKRALERNAEREQRTVADVVISTLEARFNVAEVARSELRPHEEQVVRAFAEWVLEKSPRKQRRVPREGGK